jgi:hypothetical protein
MTSPTQSPEVQNKKLTDETVRDGPTAACGGGTSTEPAFPAATMNAMHEATVSHVASAQRTSGGPRDIKVNTTGGDCATGTAGDDVRGGGSRTGGRCPSSMT